MAERELVVDGRRYRFGPACLTAQEKGSGNRDQEQQSS
jgi:hypothetical protein